MPLKIFFSIISTASTVHIIGVVKLAVNHIALHTVFLVAALWILSVITETCIVFQSTL